MRGRSCSLAIENGTRMVGEVKIDKIDDVVPVWCVPVRYGGKVVVRSWFASRGHLRGPASLYEQEYLSIFVRLCAMVADASFPYREDEVAGPGLPRVGDGIILIDAQGVVEFATPNAANALHRLGVYASAEGRTFEELGLQVRVRRTLPGIRHPHPRGGRPRPRRGDPRALRTADRARQGHGRA